MDPATRNNDFIDDFLAHYGVKGMRWGVTRAKNSQKIADRMQKDADAQRSRAERRSSKLGSGMEMRKAKQLQKKADRQQAYATKLQNKVDKKTAAKLAAKYDKELSPRQRRQEAAAAHAKWKKEASGAEMANKVYAKAAKDFEATAKIVNEDANYAGKDLNAPQNSRLRRDYDATINTLFNDHLAQASIDLTLNGEGRAYVYQLDRSTGYLRGREYQMVEHSDSTLSEMPLYRVSFDNLGQVVSIDLETELALAQSGMVEEFFLAHYGVKGMKWGVRKPAGSPPGPASEVTVKTRPGKKVKTSGGKERPASEDAIKAAVGRQIAKKSSTDALSNAELQAVVTRMQLEANYKRLNQQNVSAGQKFIKQYLSSPQTRKGIRDNINDYEVTKQYKVAKQVGDAIKKTDLSTIGN